MDEDTRVNGKMGWIWRKGVSVVKKIIAVGFVMFAAPFLVPALGVASIIALILSLPYCFFLASYVCTEKLMRKLLPATAFSRRSSNNKWMLIPKRNDNYGEDVAQVAISEPIFVQTEEERTLAIAYREDEDTAKELKSWLESIRDEGRANQSLDSEILQKDPKEEAKESVIPSDAKSEKVRTGLGDLIRNKNISGTRHEGGELESTTIKASRGKDTGNFSNAMKVKVLYSEEQIWAKIEALRKVVGYNVARNTTYSEELKALYMFTGVELPTWMLEKEDQDIAKVSEGLYFLMSVIGIK